MLADGAQIHISDVAELDEAMDMAVAIVRLARTPIRTMQVLIDRLRDQGFSDNLARRAALYCVEQGRLVIPPGKTAVQLGPKERGSKYHNRAIVDREFGRFDSVGEHKRWQTLRLMEQAGEIVGLERQVPYRLEIDGVLIAVYRADFRYWRDGAVVVEDFKGARTDVYRLKARLMRALHGVTILETGS